MINLTPIIENIIPIETSMINIDGISVTELFERSDIQIKITSLINGNSWLTNPTDFVKYNIRNCEIKCFNSHNEKLQWTVNINDYIKYVNQVFDIKYKDFIDDRNTCRKCGGQCVIDYSKVLESCPPRYEKVCTECKSIGYISFDQANELG